VKEKGNSEGRGSRHGNGVLHLSRFDLTSQSFQ
jgi:hypothetical protein